MKFDFKDLFIFEMANNHQGDIAHGKQIINECSEISIDNNLKSAVKFQFRQLDSFIHPDYINSDEPTHIKRFLSTKLSNEQFKKLLDHTKSKNLFSICTPFDERSVDKIEEMGFDIIKIGSCSATDWPLLERASLSDLPLIISTGGLTLDEIDKIVSFSEHRGLDFALMHCVSLYPTPTNLCELNQIEFMSKRYPNITIGWSTHEDPEDNDVIMVAYSKGARIFEKHVGSLSGEITSLNKYSANKKQISNWIEKYNKAKLLCGSDIEINRTEEEKTALKSLWRGVYANKNINKGETIKTSDTFFAMPFLNGQLFSGNWKNDIIAKTDIKTNEPLLIENLKFPKIPDHLILQHFIHKIKALINESRTIIGTEFDLEFSHHTGIKNFLKTGAALITIVNRDYCKKIIVQTPGQVHPNHYHKRKEETYFVLHGDLEVNLNGSIKKLSSGDKLVVQPMVWHSFTTKTGVIFEELSTTHYNNDSFYQDPKINNMKRMERKTIVKNWGGYELQDN